MKNHIMQYVRLKQPTQNSCSDYVYVVVLNIQEKLNV